MISGGGSTAHAAQTVLKKVREMTDYLNDHVLPRDVKIHPYYDRTDLIELTIRTVEHNLLLGIGLVTLVLVLFLRSLRAGIIVALTIPPSADLPGIKRTLKRGEANGSWAFEEGRISSAWASA